MLASESEKPKASKKVKQKSLSMQSKPIHEGGTADNLCQLETVMIARDYVWKACRFGGA
jgi:hypothetical protein